MRPLVPVLALLALTGCAILEGPQPLVVTAPQGDTGNAPAVVISARPATPQDLAAGIVSALARGDIQQARTYYLSDEEFDALFNWTGDDPRVARNAQIGGLLQAAAPRLAGAEFVGLETPAPDPQIQLQPGQQVSGLVVERPAAVLDGITAVANVGGVRRVVRLEGLVRVSDYWRLFSPTLEID